MQESTNRVILSCVTASPSVRRVVECSLLWGKSMGARLQFVHFGELPASEVTRLNELISSEGGTGALETASTTGNVADAICAHARLSHADMIVIGALQREAAMRDLVGSTARRVARFAGCSVMLVSTVGRGAKAWSRFVSGVDQSRASRELAENIIHAARNASEESEVWFALEYRGYKNETPRSLSGYRPIETKFTAADETYQLSSFISEISTAGITAKAITLPGRPGQEIARFSEDIHADLLGIVAPSRRLGVVDRLLSHPILLLLDQLPCSVLLYRSRAATTE